MTVATSPWPYLPFQHYARETVFSEQNVRPLLDDPSNPIVLLTPEGHRENIVVRPDDANLTNLGVPSAEVLALEATRRLIHHFSERSGYAVYNGAFVLEDFSRQPAGAVVLTLRLVHQPLPAFVAPLEGQPFQLSSSSSPTDRMSGTGSTASTLEHNEFVIEISQWLRQFGLNPLSPKSTEPKFDVAWRGGSAFVGEVKTTTESNELDQIYRAVGQVQYYAHRLQAIPVLFLEQIPDAGRMNYLRSLGLTVFCRDELGYRQPPR